MKFNGSQVSQRLLIPFIACLLFSGLGGVPARAQGQASQSPEMEQMQKKADQLENEVQDLRKQMSASAQPAKSAPAASEAGVSIPELSVTTPSGQAGQPPEKTPSQSTMDFYGYVMLDSGNNFGSIDPNRYDVMRPTKLPAYSKQFGPNGNVFFGVRQTRLGVKTLTPTALGDLKTIFEFDLFGTGVDAGQTTFRLRHAYGELGHFGAGQTWSAFMNKQSQPNTQTFENTQIRLSDGTIVFTPNLFGLGLTVTDVNYKLTSFDGGIKRHGYALEGEYYVRWLSNFRIQPPWGCLRSSITASRCDLFPCFRTKLSIISAKERGTEYVEEQAHGGADDRRAEASGGRTEGGRRGA